MAFRTSSAVPLALSFLACAAAGCSDDLEPAPEPAWTASGAMSRPRSFFQLHLLPGGEVIAAGGQIAEPEWATDSVELYEPATGTWSDAAPMGTSRAGHCSALLPSGKVLAAGGGDPADVFATAETYDPATDTWTPTENDLSVAREHSACLVLDSGKVLITGGWTFEGPSAAVDLYDPATDTFSAAEPMSQARNLHTATKLANGEVLVAGGCVDLDCETTTASAERYDPAAGSWTDAGDMPAALMGRTALLLPSGKVLVVGGCPRDGSCSNDPDNKHTTLYDPAAGAQGAWTATGALSWGRAGPALLLLDSSHVLAAAGGLGSEARTATEVYDVASETWSPGPPLSADHGNGPALVQLTATRWLLAGGVVVIDPSTLTDVSEVLEAGD